MERAVGYARVSLSRQGEQGVSLEAQQAKIETYCELYDMELVAIETDAGESGKTLARPGLQRALQRLQAGEADALVVAKLDRVTRSVRDLGDLLDLGFRQGTISLCSVGEQIDTGSAGGRMVLNVLTSVAEWEREKIAERTSAAMRFMLKQRRFTGGRPSQVPYGYKLAEDGQTLDPVPDELAVVEEARVLRTSGLSLSAVARKLAAQGMLSRTGRPFDHRQVSRMLSCRVGTAESQGARHEAAEGAQPEGRL